MYDSTASRFKFDVSFLLSSTAKLNFVLFKCVILVIIFRKPRAKTTAHDQMLCREILVTDPFSRTRSTVARGTKWEEVAENLNKIKEIYFKVDKRVVRDRYNLLSTCFSQPSRYHRAIKPCSGLPEEVANARCSSDNIQMRGNLQTVPIVDNIAVVRMFQVSKDQS